MIGEMRIMRNPSMGNTVVIISYSYNRVRQQLTERDSKKRVGKRGTRISI